MVCLKIDSYLVILLMEKQIFFLNYHKMNFEGTRMNMMDGPSVMVQTVEMTTSKMSCDQSLKLKEPLCKAKL